MKRAPRSRQRHDLYAKYHDYDSEISDLLGECGLKSLIKSLAENCQCSFCLQTIFCNRAHFHSGGGVRGASTAAVGMSFGAAIGMAAVMLASGPFTALGQLAAPVAVGMGAAVICLASRVPLLEVIPASVYGFASIAGPILLAGRAPQDAFLPTVATVVVGAAFGYASEQLANVLTKKDAAAGSMAG